MKGKIATSICFWIGLVFFIPSLLLFIFCFPMLVEAAQIEPSDGGTLGETGAAIGSFIVGLGAMLAVAFTGYASSGLFVSGCLMITPIILGNFEKRTCAIIISSISLICIAAYWITVLLLL